MRRPAFNIITMQRCDYVGWVVARIDLTAVSCTSETDDARGHSRLQGPFSGPRSAN